MSIRSGRRALACLLLSLVFVHAAPAIEPPGAPPDRILPKLRAYHAGLEVTPSLMLDATRDITVAARAQAFLREHGPAWEIRWDERNDRAALVQGSGIPLLPGRGNRLSANAVRLSGDHARDLPVVAGLARAFLDAVPGLLDLDGFDLRLDEQRSTAFGEGHTHWFLEFQQYHEGIPVDGAYAFVRIAHGNIIQFGTERLAPVAISGVRRRAGTAPEAFRAAWQQLGFPAGSRVTEWQDKGELRIYPVLPDGAGPGTPHRGLRGSGYRHLLAWRFVFRVDEHALWQVLYDPDSGKVVDLRDLTVYADATVKAQVYPTTNLDPLVEVTLPYASVNNNGAKVTDGNGVYDYSGGTASIALDGKYFRMQDTCGSIVLANSSDGNLDLGGNTGTDCATPGFGGAGNTNASRTGFYHLTLINAKARSLLPTNTWLQSKVTARMNVNQTCNASWGGTEARFYRSGPHPTTPSVTCANTGEIAAVFLHEWGHGLDQNTGGMANEYGSGEAVGDTFAFLETRDSCIGPGFYTQPGGVCYNCTSCSGVRDVGDFSLEGTRTIASPATVGADDGINCDRFACPYTSGITPYRGPMGYEGHCESLIASTANWDLKNALVGEFGESGWQRMDQIWYGSLVPSKSAYRVASGGQCNPSANVDGCGSNNWYTVYLAVDDDNGNLADGTPNGCRIWDAFNAHGIACGARPACTESGAPGFALEVEPVTASVCAGDDATYDIHVGALNGYDGEVALGLEDVPAGATAAFSANPVQAGGYSRLVVSGTSLIAPGQHGFQLQGTADIGTQSVDLGLDVTTAGPDTVSLQLPPDGETGVPTQPTLHWDSAAGADSYRVEVATDAGFSHSIVDTVLTGTSYLLASPLDTSTTYYWRVTAINACGSGTPSTVFSFRTLSAPGDCGADQDPVVLLSEDFSGGLGGFTSSAGAGTATWAITGSAPAGSPSGGNAVLAVDVGTTSDQRLVSPAVTLPTDQLPLSLQFWNHQQLESASGGGCWDGGLLEISTDGGGSWTQVTGSALLYRPYDAIIPGTYDNPLANMEAWCGNPRDWEKYIVDLNAWAGQTVRFRWRLGTDASVDRPGWHVDDIRVQACQAKQVVDDRIFAGGFEPTL